MMNLTEAKARIKDIPISTIIGKFIPLHKRGVSLMALCPFHNDSRPSMNVNDQKGLFRCFACDTGGDSIAFVQKFRSLDFKQALEEIYHVMGWPVDIFTATGENADISLRWKKALSLLKRACDLYKEQTLKSGAGAYQDFLQQRQLSPLIAEMFQIGYAPNNNIFLHSLLQLPLPEKKEALVLALELGLIKEGLENKEGRKQYFDTFRERIIFPIWDSFGQIIAFSSRALHTYQKAKYLNSPESFVFKKGNTLYGYHLAKEFIREKDQVIIIEGHMDLIMLQKHGIRNVVALMGTAFNEKALGKLKDLTKNFVLCLDRDEAGMKAMVKLNRLLLSWDILPKILDLSPHKDPDEFLKGEGKEAFTERMHHASPFLDQILEELIPPKFLESPEFKDVEKKLDMLHCIFEELRPLGKNLLAQEKIVQMSQKLGLQSPIEEILKFYDRFLNGQARIVANNLVQTLVPRPIKVQNQNKNLAVETLSKSEELLIQQCIFYPRLLEHEEMPKLLELLEQNEVKRFVNQLKGLVLEIDEKEFSSVIRDFILKDDGPLGLREAVGKTLFLERPASIEEKSLSKLVGDLKVKLQKEKLLRVRNDLREKQKNCSSSVESQEILKQLVSIEKQFHDIKQIKST